MSSEIAIKVENLSKCYHIYEKPRDRLKQMFSRGRRQYYREFWALKDVSFEVKKGETIGIIGRNGSGKSTLLQIICGTLTPTSGTVQTNGRIAALLELGSGFNPEFTGRENIYMTASIYGLTSSEADARFDQIAAFADIGDHLEQAVKTYSSGMYVRLAFAVIAHVDANILVIDEALAVGDAFFTQKCMRFLREFMKNGTVLLVSHDTAAIKNFCSIANWLDKGHLRERGIPKEVCEHYLQSYYEAQHDELGVKNSEPATDIASLQTLQREHTQDQRLPFLNASNLRNDLKLFQFNPDAPSFGLGGSRIIRVELCDSAGEPLAWAVGGEDVMLVIDAVALQDLHSPIVGFVVKDRLGQGLFGDNTYLSYAGTPFICRAGQFLKAHFNFQMPRLPVGDYSITIAIADGTQQEHVQHQWIFDAFTFRSESTSVSAGLVGIPMSRIDLTVQNFFS